MVSKAAFQATARESRQVQLVARLPAGRGVARRRRLRVRWDRAVVLVLHELVLHHYQQQIRLPHVRRPVPRVAVPRLVFGHYFHLAHLVEEHQLV